ncbi:acyloxyacyl hydrolase [Pseudomonas sp. NPDC008258]|uniref:acyloxyacyl hydrolase n=1 Tax=Pseudomonas sp. NPDC008258 TaxID=3364418 RepID=UPI0036EBB1D3
MEGSSPHNYADQNGGYRCSRLARSLFRRQKFGSDFKFQDRIWTGAKICETQRVGTLSFHHSNAGIRQFYACIDTSLCSTAIRSKGSRRRLSEQNKVPFRCRGFCIS